MNIRDIRKDEYEALGELMVAVYQQLAGFPSPDEQPEYYRMLAQIGVLSEKQATRVFIARANALLGGVVYLSDIAAYGALGFSWHEENTAAMRLLGVSPLARGQGIGRALAQYCIDQAQSDGNQQIVLHTTQAMQIAWRLYESLGFARDLRLDFKQKELPVYGFRLTF